MIRRNCLSTLLALLILLPVNIYAQNWSGILDPSRAEDWSSSLYSTIPTRTTQCGATIAPYTGSASAINNAISACPAGQFVHLGTGTFNLSSSITFSKGGVTLLGDGPANTTLTFSGVSSCVAGAAPVCIKASGFMDESNAAVQPGGSNACAWTGSYAQGGTTITLNNCGSAPPVSHMLVLDQANESADTGGAWQCDNANTASPPCRENGSGNTDGRVIGGATHSQAQTVTITSVKGSGSGPYTVTISPGLYANNWRGSQSPGAWWAGEIDQVGLEAMTVDNTNIASSTVSVIQMGECYECWIKNVRSIMGKRDHVMLYEGARNIIRDSYFFNTLNHQQESYGIEPYILPSDTLIENNIFQQISSPVLPSNAAGTIVGYNFTIDNVFGATGSTWMQITYSQHNAGQHMVLFEGNHVNGFSCDNVWGFGGVGTTFFRNRVDGLEPGKSTATYPIEILSGCRGVNIVGNVLGTSGYHNNYEASTSTGSGNCSTSVYEIGWGSGPCSTGTPGNDPVVRATMLRWGNYDVVSGTRFNASEVPTTGVAFINANPVPANTTLPSSFYLRGVPSWWPSGKAFPPIGPDVTGGNQKDLNGGTLGGHANTIPAQDCFSNVMFGPTDGSGGVLSFDANKCYGQAGPPPNPPTGVAAVVR
jgi:hypothetical protein